MEIKVFQIVIREMYEMRFRRVIQDLKQADVPDELIGQLRTIFLGMQDELMDTREQLVRKDYELQNALNKLKQLESVERQNKRLKAIIAEEWKEMTG